VTGPAYASYVLEANETPSPGMSVTRRCESERRDRGHFCGLAVFTATDEMMGEALGKNAARLLAIDPASILSPIAS